MIVSCEETVRAVDAVVEDCLRQAGINEPPVDPVGIIAALGLTAQRDTALAARGERRTVNGQGVILIRPDQRDERECFALAHEIGEEVAAAKILDRLDINDATERWREELANQFAGRLLCPTEWLRLLVAETGSDLRQLKEIFCTASHEVIARQLLSLEQPTIITICDRGALTTRLANTTCPRQLTPAEQSAWHECHTTGGDIDRQEEALRVQAWAIHEADWRREILRTTRLDE